MRLLLLLLACFAATDAWFVSYSQFVRSNCVLEPSPSIYKYSVFFRSSWCTTNYYNPILKVYPGSDCGKDGWKESSIAEVKTELENLLKESLLTMVKEMVAKRQAWEKQLEAKLKQYSDCYKTNLTKYYDSKIAKASAEEKVKLEAERDQKIIDYNAKLEEYRKAAVKKYNDSLVKKIVQVQDFHKEIVRKAQDCLVQRLAKIEEYQKELASKISTYLLNYYKYLMASLKKRENDYRKTLVAVHGSESFAQVLVDNAVSDFYTHELENVRAKLVDYTTKLMEGQKRYVTAYACSYRCYFSNSRLQFYKKQYTSYCNRYTGWCAHPKQYYKSYYISPFEFSWTKKSYSNLRTCDLDSVNKSENDILKELEAMIDAEVKKYTDLFNEWEARWTTNHERYVEKYRSCVKARHEWIISRTREQYICASKDRQLTPEQEAALAKLKQDLEEKATKEVAAYAAKLAAKLKEVSAEYKKSIAEYRQKAEEAVKQLVAKYAACLSKRTADIATYKQKLETSRDTTRQQILEKMSSAKLVHMKSYISMLRCFHGDQFPKSVTDLLDAYAVKLVEYCKSVMTDYDDHWTKIIPELVMHYGCCYKCTAKMYLPSYAFGTYYKWTVCYPTAKSYAYYYTSYCARPSVGRGFFN